MAVVWVHRRLGRSAGYRDEGWEIQSNTHLNQILLEMPPVGEPATTAFDITAVSLLWVQVAAASCPKLCYEWADPDLPSSLKTSTGPIVRAVWLKGGIPALLRLFDKDGGTSIHTSRLRSVSAGGVTLWSNAALLAAGNEDRPGGSSAHAPPPAPRGGAPYVAGDLRAGREAGIPATVASARASPDAAAASSGPVFRYEWADPYLANKQSTRNVVMNAWHKGGVPEVLNLLDKHGGSSSHASKLRSVSTGGNVVWSNAALPAAGNGGGPGGSSAHAPPEPLDRPHTEGGMEAGLEVAAVAPARASPDAAATVFGPEFRYEWADPSLDRKKSTRNAVTGAWHKGQGPGVLRLLDKHGGTSIHASRLRSVSTGGNVVWSNAALLAAKSEEPAAVVEEEQSGSLAAKNKSGLRKRCLEEAGPEAGPGGSTVPPSSTSPDALTGKVEEGGLQSPGYGVGSTAAHAAVGPASVADAPRGQGGAGAAADAAPPMQLPGPAPPLPLQADEDDDVALEALLRRAAVMTAGAGADKALLLHAVTAWFDR